MRHSLLVLPYGRSKNLDDWDLYGSLDVQAVRLFQGLPDQQMVLDFSETGITALEFGPSLMIQPDADRAHDDQLRGRRRHLSLRFDRRRCAATNFLPGTFKGKIVLVGASATGIGDLRSTPFGGINYPGVEIHANVIDNILNRYFLVRGANQVAVDLLLIFLFGVPLGLWLALAQPRSMLFGLLLLVPFGFGVWYAFLHGWWLNFIVPSGTLVANVGFVAMYRALVEEKEKRRVRGAFQQYLSPEVIRRLLENPDLVKPRKTEITVMFSDVRGFTTISEKLDAQELAALLNEYLTDMTQIVFRHNGTLDKYIGDAVMAFWGAPFEDPDHATEGCHAALEMIARLKEMQKKWKAEGKPVLDIGVGLCTGVASVGNMGSELRYGYTALGDTVNLSSRLEGLNKEYATHILLSDTTYAAVEDPLLVFRELDLIRVKGKLQPVTLYELVAARGTPEGDAPDLEERLEFFAQGRACYRERRWQDAQIVFEKLLERWPDDGPARMYSESLQGISRRRARGKLGRRVCDDAQVGRASACLVLNCFSGGNKSKANRLKPVLLNPAASENRGRLANAGAGEIPTGPRRARCSTLCGSRRSACALRQVSRRRVAACRASLRLPRWHPSAKPNAFAGRSGCGSAPAVEYPRTRIFPRPRIPVSREFLSFRFCRTGSRP